MLLDNGYGLILCLVLDASVFFSNRINKVGAMALC
jgi:hypothetical protein